MDGENVWLGKLEKPIWQAMLVCIGITVLIYIWLVFNQIFFEDAIGMHEMIRPQGRPIVWIMLISMSASIILASIFLSNKRGAIEIEPDGFFDVFSLIVSRLAMIMTALIVIVMFYEVVARYVFSSPTLWANELALWIASFVFLIAAQYAMQQRSHIRIYIIHDIMPRWMQKTSDVISLVLIVGFTYALVWGNYSDAVRRMMRMETFGTAWDPPLPGIVKPAIVIITVLITIQAISNLIADWNKAAEHHSPLDDIDEAEISSIRKTLEK